MVREAFRTEAAREVAMLDYALPQTEEQKVGAWRLHVLIEAGYPLSLAERLADSEADLHRAVELLVAGCRPAVAALILL